MATLFPESYQQIHQILAILGQFHGDVSAFCGKVLAQRAETRYGQLVTLLAKRQKEMATFIGNTSGVLDSKVLATWIQFVPFEQIEQLREEIESGLVPLEDFPQRVMEIQSKIAEFIQSLEQESEFEGEHDFFKLLGGRERSEAKYYAAVLRGFEDS